MPGDSIAGPLLEFLRATFGDTALQYAEEPQPISGGFDTLIYGFRLSGNASVEPLIVRIFRDAAGPWRAQQETAVQNAVADAGGPAPRVIATCTDVAVLGAAFTVMQRVPGQTLLSTLPAGLPRMPRLLAETARALHRIDPPPDLAKLLDVDFTHYRKELRAGLERPGMDGMRAGLDWLDANFPAAGRRALVHLDLHPANVMVEGGRVTGVIDWANAALADPAADVAVTRVTTLLGPLDAPHWARLPLQGVRRWLAGRFTRLYTHGNAVPAANIRYYEAMRCYHAMHVVANGRLDAAEGRQPSRTGYAWGTPEQVAGMTRLFERNTGVRLVLPSVEGA